MLDGHNLELKDEEFDFVDIRFLIDEFIKDHQYEKKKEIKKDEKTKELYSYRKVKGNSNNI